MPVIKKSHVVQKRNILNEVRSNNMTVQELRFFSIYLSKINANDVSTRLVRFPMDDFRAIMELGRLNMTQLKQTANRLLGKIINVPNENGGFRAFQLFKECNVDRDSVGRWYIEVDAHDKSLPLMFDFKGKYFSYKLWNALRLKSTNQLRMYEILKQYETKGFRELSVEYLKELLGIGKDEYDGRWNNFKKDVLDVCQKALAEHTDIKFTYAPHGRKGRGGKILALKFIIEKNEDYTDQICLEEFIQTMKDEAEEKAEQEKEMGKDSKAAEIVNAYRDLNCGERFGGLSDDEILELNQRAFDYLMGAGRIDELGLPDQAAYVGKQALHTNRKKPDKFYNYLMKAVSKNYAEA